jgi:hypothetical protein
MIVTTYVANWWRRASTESKTDAVLTVVDLLAKLWSIGFTIWMGGAKLWGAPGWAAYCLFAPSVIFIAIKGYLPRQTSKKFVDEDQKRTEITGTTISAIASALRNRYITPERKLKLVIDVLQAIKYQVERITAERDSNVYDVTFLSYDEARQRLTEIVHTTSGRSEKTFVKESREFAVVLDNQRFYYERRCADSASSRSIFASPVISISGEETLKLGIVTIESAKAHFLDGLEEKTDTQVLPYLNLLKLILILDQAFNNGDGRSNV